MKTETDRRGFGGKVSATRVCVPWRFALFSRVLRCARTGYAREGSSSFFPPAHCRRARFGWVFRVQDGVWYMKWWRRRCEVGIRKPGHRLSRPPLFVLPNSSSNQPSNFALRILVGDRGNVSGCGPARPRAGPRAARRGGAAVTRTPRLCCCRRGCP